MRNPVAAIAVMLSGASACIGLGSSVPATMRAVPQRALPVPQTVSPILQSAIAKIAETPLQIPRTTEEWRTLEAPAQGASADLERLRTRFGVSLTPKIIGGVHCYLVTPKVVNVRNQKRLLLGLHSGGFVFSAGETGIFEAIVMAGSVGVKAIAVDYRVLPEHPFPAAIDDVMAVWKDIIKSTRPDHIGVFGSSVGGSLVLSLVQRARREALPIPGVVMSGTPWSDMSKTGDSYYSNDGVDGTIRYDEFWEAVAKLYANGRRLNDPLISPVYGDFTGFPPTFLVTGTRDLFLSNTVRVHRKLLEAGGTVELEVEEGQPHMYFLTAAMIGAPEGLELYSRIASFFDAHLGS